MNPTNCKYCGAVVAEGSYFCQSCGKKLKEKPASLSVLSLVWLLILSTLLPPFGIGVTIRYIRDENDMAKVVGWISLVITIFAVVFMSIWAWQSYQDLMTQINTQLGGMTF